MTLNVQVLDEDAELLLNQRKTIHEFKQAARLSRARIAASRRLLLSFARFDEVMWGYAAASRVSGSRASTERRTELPSYAVTRARWPSFDDSFA